MAKITSVEPQKKNLHRFNIFLDGVFAFGADEDLVVERRLVVGKEIGAEDLEKILFEAEVGKLMEKVYGQLNVRARSEREIRDYLKRVSFKRKIKGDEEISEMVLGATLDRARSKGLVNDLEFAKAWVEARRKSKNKGVVALKQELFQKGISREIVEEVMSSEFRVQSEEGAAEKALEGKLRVWKNLTVMEFRKKGLEFLMRKGFEYSVAKGVVEKIAKRDYNKGEVSEESEGYNDDF